MLRDDPEFLLEKRHFEMGIYSRLPLKKIFDKYSEACNLFLWPEAEDIEWAVRLLQDHPEISVLRFGRDLGDFFKRILLELRCFCDDIPELLKIAAFSQASLEDIEEGDFSSVDMDLACYKPHYARKNILQLFLSGDVDTVSSYLRDRRDFLDDVSSVDSEDAVDYEFVESDWFNESESLITRTEEDEVALLALNYFIQSDDVRKSSSANRFCLTFSRGIHYLTNRMTQSQRQAYRQSSQVDKPMLSSAAIDVLKVTAVDPHAATIAEQNSAGKSIREKIRALNDGDPTAPLVTSSIRSPEKHKNPRDALQQRYTNGYQPFHDFLTTHVGEEGHFLERFSSKCNPFVSCSDLALHPIKYALGHKAFGKSDKELNPGYRETFCKPMHPYLGKVCLILVSLSKLPELDPSFVLSMHAAFDITVSTHFSNNILPEREVSFPGFIEREYVKCEMQVRVPNFQFYKPYYQRKYGLSKHIFDSFKEKISGTLHCSEERDAVLSKLYDHLSNHYSKKLERASHFFSKAMGAVLVYKGLDHSFKFEPALVEEAKRLNDEKRAAGRHK